MRWGQGTLQNTFAILIVVLFSQTANVSAAEPWRLHTALNAPDWLKLSGETRVRYETLGGQFRAAGSGGDQALFFRTLVHAEADIGPFAIGAELQDSRGYLTDSGTPLSSSFVNPLDALQAYVKINAPGLLGRSSKSEIQLGRQTVSIGSKRQIERVSYANVIRTFTGGHAISTNDRGDALHLLLVAPVARLPSERALAEDNVLDLDSEQFGRRIWAVHYRRANAFPALADDLWAEAFVYGLNEEDTERFQTPNRRYVGPGFRLFRQPKPGQFDIDMEGAFRVGKRRATSSATDTQDLNVFATMLLARGGYTFDHPWRPRIALQYYWASGDEDPNDNRFGQFERLFGARRTDLNNTSIHGPLTPANLSAPGIRLSIAPSSRWNSRLHYSAASLASETDSFVIARLRDTAGASGRFLGHTLDTRFQYRIAPDNLVFEVGASAFFFGEFTRTVDNGPSGNQTLFGYAQITATF